jgi:hypothetical protein
MHLAVRTRPRRRVRRTWPSPPGRPTRPQPRRALLRSPALAYITVLPPTGQAASRTRLRHFQRRLLLNSIPAPSGRTRAWLPTMHSGASERIAAAHGARRGSRQTGSRAGTRDRLSFRAGKASRTTRSRSEDRFWTFSLEPSLYLPLIRPPIPKESRMPPSSVRPRPREGIAL